MKKRFLKSFIQKCGNLWEKELNKNIWIINHYAVPENAVGGTRHFDISKKLKEKGFRPTIFASTYNHFTRNHKDIGSKKAKQEEINGVKFVWIKTGFDYIGNSIKRFFNMLSFYKGVMSAYKSHERPDIVIGSSVHLFACLAAYRICKKTDAKFILEIRDLWPQTLIELGKLNKLNPLTLIFGFLEKYLAKKAKKIITLLPGVYKYLVKIGVERKKIIYLPNGINIERYDEFSCKKSRLEEEIFNILKKKFCCIYAGSHGIANELETIVLAAEKLQNECMDDIVFLMFGDGPEKRKLQDLVKKKRITNIQFYSSQPKESIIYILKNADVGLITMKNTGLYKYGISLNKMFDYMYAKLPVIFSGDVFNNIVNEAECGFTIPPENYIEFAEAIKRMYRMDENSREILGEKGYNYMSENHNMTILADKLVKEVL
jgi:glycosyltransferase involved in cell wall biosynthesis